VKKVSFGSKPAAAGNGGSADDWVNARERSTEPAKRLTIDIPESLHRRFKTACAMVNDNMADVVREMLEKRYPPTTPPSSNTETQKHDSP
jgi:hypothetical protein